MSSSEAKGGLVRLGCEITASDGRVFKIPEDWKEPLRPKVFDRFEWLHNVKVDYTYPVDTLLKVLEELELLSGTRLRDGANPMLYLKFHDHWVDLKHCGLAIGENYKGSFRDYLEIKSPGLIEDSPKPGGTNANTEQAATAATKTNAAGRAKEPTPKQIHAYKLRYSFGCSQETIAKKLGVRQSTISRWVKAYKRWLKQEDLPVDEDPESRRIDVSTVSKDIIESAGLDPKFKDRSAKRHREAKMRRQEENRMD
ncbi:MAG: helix-turn-helix transcriptional regulator [Planctomycetes bacterium]|nr:helix-turn-helix transcriptional regulator [Planctomycetota bacterium]